MMATVLTDLGLWVLVVFLLLVFVLTRFARKPLLEALRNREQNIAAALAEAEQAREEVRRMRADFQAQTNLIAERVREMEADALRDAEYLKEEMAAAARAEIQAEGDRLKREIATARDQALKQLWDETAILATRVAAGAVRRELTADDHRRLIDEALTELGQANVGWKERTIY